MVNSAIPLNMLETKNIKKFIFMDMLSQIFPTVIGDLLEYLSDINQKLSC